MRQCDKCQKTIKGVPFPCSKCNRTFCVRCRLPEIHKCTYDYKTEKVQLEKVVKDKVVRI